MFFKFVDFRKIPIPVIKTLKALFVQKSFFGVSPDAFHSNEVHHSQKRSISRRKSQ